MTSSAPSSSAERSRTCSTRCDRLRTQRSSRSRTSSVINSTQPCGAGGAARQGARDLARLTAHAERVLCHMDLHDANVLRGPDGPVIIDWMNASAAPPEADVARTRLVVGHEKFNSPDEADELATVLAAYIARTEELVPGLVGASREWDRVLAAARLDERPPDAERDAILAQFDR